ncbi:MAG: hypothetical protein MK329_14690 [Pirellulales bacterium]|nr:hypothetical protein [Pirellulales bacterium]
MLETNVVESSQLSSQQLGKADSADEAPEPSGVTAQQSSSTANAPAEMNMRPNAPNTTGRQRRCLMNPGTKA